MTKTTYKRALMKVGKNSKWTRITLHKGKTKQLICLCPDKLTANIVVGALRETT